MKSRRPGYGARSYQDFRGLGLRGYLCRFWLMLVIQAAYDGKPKKLRQLGKIVAGSKSRILEKGPGICGN